MSSSTSFLRSRNSSVEAVELLSSHWIFSCTASRTSVLAASGMEVLFSTADLVEYKRCSSSFRASTRSRARSSSSLYFSASLIMRSMSSLDIRLESFSIVILCVLPVPFSSAETLRMPLASMSKDTSICGVPRGAGGMPVSSNWPIRRLSRVNCRSPSKTWMVTAG